MIARRQFLLASLALTSLARAWEREMKIWNVAHRGGARLAPENTMAAFTKAVELGADAYELDIHLTADHDLVVIHDDNLQRTSHRPGVVYQMTLAELQAADPTIPSLRQALRQARGRCRVLVEIKQPSKGPHYAGLEEVLLTQLREEEMLDQVIVIAFEKEPLLKLRGRVETGYLHYLPVTDLKAIKDELEVGTICPQYRLATAQYIDQAHSLNLRVNAWTVNEEKDMRALLEAGCDLITTDRPDLLKQLLADS